MLRAGLLALTLLTACGAPEAGSGAGSGPALGPAASPSAPAQPERLDMHVHLVNDVVEELLATLDRHGITQAVVLASPHLDPSLPRSAGDDRFSSWRAANDRLLTSTKAHRDRLLPFVTLDPATLEAGELEAWLERGACGVKLYIGHRSLRQRALDDARHALAFAELERRGVPVLLHVNSFRYEQELDALLRAYPKLELVCAHLCGSRSDLDRLERIMRAHPTLRFDTSHGAGKHGADGFANLERERERLRALIEAAPERFMFGSDLVTTIAANNMDATRLEWDRQIAANLGLLTSERFEFWREQSPLGAAKLGDYRGLALDAGVLEQVLGANARSWLRGCGAAPGG